MTLESTEPSDEQIDKMLDDIDDSALNHGDDLPGLALNSRGRERARAIVREALAAPAVQAEPVRVSRDEAIRVAKEVGLIGWISEDGNYFEWKEVQKPSLQLVAFAERFRSAAQSADFSCKDNAVDASAMQMLWDDQPLEEKEHYRSVVRRAALSQSSSTTGASAAHPEAAQAESKECRHCGWMCTPNAGKSKAWYPLVQVEPAADAARANGNAVLVPADKLAELQAEAGRYQWLRTRDVTFETEDGPLFVSYIPEYGVKLDANIDAAMEAERKSKKE